jgi:hypothetical protein
MSQHRRNQSTAARPTTACSPAAMAASSIAGCEARFAGAPDRSSIGCRLRVGSVPPLLQAFGDGLGRLQRGLGQVRILYDLVLNPCCLAMQHVSQGLGLADKLLDLLHRRCGRALQYRVDIARHQMIVALRLGARIRGFLPPRSFPPADRARRCHAEMPWFESPSLEARCASASLTSDEYRDCDRLAATRNSCGTTISYWPRISRYLSWPIQSLFRSWGSPNRSH